MGELKNRKYFNTTLPIEMIEKIEELHQKTRISKSKLAEEAWEKMFKRYRIPYEKNEK